MQTECFFINNRYSHSLLIHKSKGKEGGRIPSICCCHIPFHRLFGGGVRREKKERKKEREGEEEKKERKVRGGGRENLVEVLLYSETSFVHYGYFVLCTIIPLLVVEVLFRFLRYVDVSVSLF